MSEAKRYWVKELHKSPKKERVAVVRVGDHIDALSEVYEMGRLDGLREHADELAVARDANNQSYCTWCGFVGAKDRDVMANHMMECEKHPVHALMLLKRKVEGMYQDHATLAQDDGPDAEPKDDVGRALLELFPLLQAVLPVKRDVEKETPSIKDITPKTIIRNAIRCAHCDDEIESKSVHDFKWCKCGTVAVDGGHEYLKRCFKDSPDDYFELSDMQP